MDHQMEKLVHDRTKRLFSTFKNDIRDRILQLHTAVAEQGVVPVDDTARTEKFHALTNELMEYVYEYECNEESLFSKDDFAQKKRRVKNDVPVLNRCSACRADKKQCTRKRRDDSEFCGTHFKGTPHGLISEGSSEDAGQEVVKLGVFAEEIAGIVYYLDKFGNVYNTRDILEDRMNPTVIAKWVKDGDRFTIPEYGIM